MRELSVTCTVGEGCEIHNHDLEYRESLKHVHDRPDGVIEVIPYVDYRTKINELMRPYIDEYNANVDRRYQEAWERYNNGEIKSKPKRKDFPKMGYDYYNDHLNDTYYDQHDRQTKPLPLFRELLIGIGDREDRQNGTITEEEAKEILSHFVEKFRERFPNFYLLGATIHLDEEGFYHAHIDYKPITHKPMTKGLNCSISQEEALKAMKLEPEQALINGRDKAPLRFNAFRNVCYKLMDEEMRAVGIYLQYGASKDKDPEKDSSTHQNLDNFKDLKDTRREKDKIWDQGKAKAIEIKHQTNIVQDIIDNGEPSEENLAKAIETGMQIQKALEEVERSPKTVMRKGYNVTFHLFDQLKTVVADFAETIGKLCLKIKELTKRLGDTEKELGELSEDYNHLVEDYNALADDYDERGRTIDSLERENSELKEQLSKKRSLNDTIKLSEQFLDDKIKEHHH